MALTDNLISYWALEEASGTRVDSVVASANDLSDNHTVTQAGGKIGNAGQFTAANQEYLSHADNASLSTGDIDFTITGWVYFDTLPAAISGIISKYANGTNNREYLLYYNTNNHAPNNRFSFNVSKDGTNAGGSLITVDANNFGTPSTGTWYFVVVWHDSVNNTVNIQVNDGAVDSVAWANGVLDGNSDFIIGALNNDVFTHDGRIDEVGFWKRVLTSGERTQLYNGGAGLAYPFVVASSDVLRPKMRRQLQMLRGR